MNKSKRFFPEFRTCLLVGVILLYGLLQVSSLWSAPFINQEFQFKQPDGSLTTVRGWGDEYYAVFETLNGYTVVQDPVTKFTCYARLSEDGNDFVSTDVKVGSRDPQTLGLQKKLRINPASAKKQSLQMYQKMGAVRRCEIRRKESKTVLQASTLNGSGTILSSPPGRQTVGTYKGLCLLIDFSDDQETISQNTVDNYCNLPGYTGYSNNGSIYDYFYDVSNQQLSYTNIVTVYYRASQPKTYYTDESIPYGTRARELITEALTYFKNNGFNFSQLSVDGSGYVYALNVFYAGASTNNWAKGLWPHAWSLASPFNLGGGKYAYDYQMTNMGSELTIGTFLHENGHMLCDFPDLYDYGYESNGVGHFSLMASGGSARNPTQVDAYLKYKAGWASSVTDLTTSAFNTYSASSSNNGFFRYAKSGTEYFIIENRNKSGRDAYLPASGLAIWHIDELGSNNNEQMTPSQHYELTLVQADNAWHLEYGQNYGDALDLYYSGNNTSFHDNTLPNARWWDTTVSSLTINAISVAGTLMTFNVIPGPLYNFAWNEIPLSQFANVPFAVTITAKNINGNTVAGFSDTANLSGWISNEVVIGNDSGSSFYPMATYYHDARTQVIYLASELGGSKSIKGLSLYVNTVPGQTMNNWTIRMKHTSLSSYPATPAWEGSDWTTVYQNNETVSLTGWVTFLFTTPFDYNGTDNLMVDFSFNNSSYTSYGYCRSSSTGQYRSIVYETDSEYGDPLNWSGTTSPTPIRNVYFPNIKLFGDATPVAITPSVSGNFVNGVWTGNITVFEGTTGMHLHADDGNGHTGDTNVFSVNIAVIGVLDIPTTSLPNGTVDRPYSSAPELRAAGGVAPYTWSIISGSLPAGLSLNASTGAITGTPTAHGTSNFTVQVADNQSPAVTTSKPLRIIVAPVYFISGFVKNSAGTGIGGVTLTANNGGGSGITNDAGFYSVPVPSGWSGTITPSLTGCTFNPTSKSYSNVTAGRINQNYAITSKRIISGYVRNTTGTPISGITVNFQPTTGTATSVTTNTSGFYTKALPYGWSGTVRPTRTGVTFTPTSRPYTNITADQANQDFTVNNVSISGFVKNSTATTGIGIEDVTVTFRAKVGTTFPDITTTAETDADGAYTASIPYGWTGRATPTKEDCTSFVSAYKDYTNVTSNKINQNYTVRLVISGYIRNTAGKAISGITVNFRPTIGTASTATTNSAGFYTKTLSYGWSGTVAPTRTGVTFSPSSRPYSNITTDQTNQDFTITTAYSISGVIKTSGGIGIGGVTVTFRAKVGTIFPTITTTADTAANGAYTASIPYGWTGRATPSRSGYTFSSAYKDYTNVTANKISQNYTGTVVLTLAARFTPSGIVLKYLPGLQAVNPSDVHIDYPIQIIGPSFLDPDGIDTHLASQFEIYSGEGGAIFGKTVQQGDLTTTAFSPRLLLPGKSYTLQLRYQDSKKEFSIWSDPLLLATIPTEQTLDSDNNGIPDDQTPTDTILAQYNFKDYIGLDTAKVVINPLDQKPVLVESGNEEKIAYFAVITPQNNPPSGTTPSGLFLVRVENIPAEMPVVILRFTFPDNLPANTAWYCYDYAAPEGNSWIPYPDVLLLGNDVTVELEDGGKGDTDGVKNGTIINISGPVSPMIPE